MISRETLQELLAQAKQARAHAYCSYSGLAVGAALQTSAGTVFSGCNVENASYGLAICAERNAVAAAVAGGMRPGMLVALALVTDAPAPAVPCGACLQVLAEFAAPGCQILCTTTQGATQEYQLSELLPLAFKL